MNDKDISDQINKAIYGNYQRRPRFMDEDVPPPIFSTSAEKVDWENIFKRSVDRFPTARQETRTLRFKDVVFTVYIPDKVMDFFENDKAITRDELRLLEITHPKEHAKIKQAWMTAWKDLQALVAFEKD